MQLRWTAIKTHRLSTQGFFSTHGYAAGPRALGGSLGQGHGTLEGLVMVDPCFWSGRRVLLTGHTGFKGSWLVLILHSLGAKVTGYALDPISKPNFFDNLKLSKFLENDYRNNIDNFFDLNKAIKKYLPQTTCRKCIS